MIGRYGEILNELAAALLAIPYMNDASYQGSGRALVVNRLRHYGYKVSEPPSALYAEPQCRLILDAVLGQAGALNELAKILYTDDGSNSSKAFFDLVGRELSEYFLTLADKLDLIEKLELAIPDEKLGHYYLVIVGAEPTQVIEDVNDLVYQIRQRGSGASVLDPLAHLIGLVALDIGSRSRADAYKKMARALACKIDDWATTAKDVPSQLELLLAAWDRLERKPVAAHRGNAFVVLRLDPANSSPADHFLLSAWLYYGDQLIKKCDVFEGPLAMSDVKREAISVINEAIELAEKRHADLASIIEFILPRRQMNLAVESWSTEEDEPLPLGMHYVVVVRDLRRQQKATQRQAWRELWAEVRDGNMSAEQVISRWVTCGERPLGQGELLRQLSLQRAAGIGLTFPPDVHQFPVADMLNSGMPVAVWPHSCDHTKAVGKERALAGSAGFKERFCRLSAGQPIRDLPEIVKRMRRETISFEDPASGGIALLWDDPSRIVEPPGFRLAAPTAVEQPHD